MNGAAVGAGLDMALMCDLRYAAAGRALLRRVRQGRPHPGDGGTYFLPCLVGVAKALELMWTGDFIQAEEAERSAWSTGSCRPTNSCRRSTSWRAAWPTARRWPSRTIKRAVYQGLRMELRAHLDMISSHMGFIRQTHDHREARAFVEKRAPVPRRLMDGESNQRRLTEEG